MYAVHYNHKKERHLNGGVLDSAFSRPAILITDADNSMLEGAVRSRETLDKELREAVMATVRANGASLFSHLSQECLVKMQRRHAVVPTLRDLEGPLSRKQLASTCKRLCMARRVS